MYLSREGAVRESLTRRWTAGIDWVTYIARDRGAVPRLTQLANELQEEHGDETDVMKPFRLARYEGWRTPAVRVGQSGASCLLQVSGQVAAASWTRMASCGGAPTRLDVQVSLELPTSQPRFYMRLLSPSTKMRLSSRSSLPRRSLRSDNRGYLLGTVGDRTKARYLRVYDKGVESKAHAAGHLWRMELEAKRGLARKLWLDLMEATDVPQWCFDSVSEQWKSSGYCWPLSESTRGVRGVSAYEPRDRNAVKLARWTRTSVAPAMQRLVAKYGRDAVLEMLALNTPSDVPQAKAAARRSA